jgi:hypothetical protein
MQPHNFALNQTYDKDRYARVDSAVCLGGCSHPDRVRAVLHLRGLVLAVREDRGVQSAGPARWPGMQVVQICYSAVRNLWITVGFRSWNQLDFHGRQAVFVQLFAPSNLCCFPDIDGCSVVNVAGAMARGHNGRCCQAGSCARALTLGRGRAAADFTQKPLNSLAGRAALWGAFRFPAVYGALVHAETLSKGSLGLPKAYPC